MGSSELPNDRTVCCAFGQPLHPGRSNTQNSWLEGASAAIISKRHLNLIAPIFSTAMRSCHERIITVIRLPHSEGELFDLILRNQILPLFGLLNPKRRIYIFELRALAAESRHGTAMCKHIHISPPTNNTELKVRSL
jgi:hypothetical protein